MSTAQYIGRQVDLLAFDGDLLGGRTALDMQLVSSSHGGKVTAGLQQLAQRFLLLLFKQKGSVLHWPAAGCDFMTQVRQGAFRTPLDVFSGFASALLDIRMQLRADERSTDLADERFGSAELTQVEFTDGGISIWLKLQSRAPTGTAVYIVPLPIKT